MGLFRIFYAAFYLWHLSWRIGSDLAGLPVPENRRVFIVNWLPKHEMSPLLFQGLESLLAAALVILLAGYRVQLATAVVLVLGCLNEALYSSTGRESSPIFLAFYIPLFMLLAGRWGETYSLDALLHSRAGQPTTSPADTGWSHFLPARATLVILSAMFFSAMLLKIAFGGVWLAHPDLLANAMLHKNIEAALIELPLNPLAPLIAQQPALFVPLQFSVLLFEGLFFLVLVDRDSRRLWLGVALVFHTVNANWLIVTFTPILVVYGLFIDWQGVRQRLWPWPIRIADRLPTPVLIAATLLSSVAVGLFWDYGDGLRNVLRVGGLVDWRTIWWPFGVLGITWISLATASLLRRLIYRVRRREAPDKAGCRAAPGGRSLAPAVEGRLTQRQSPADLGHGHFVAQVPHLDPFGQVRRGCIGEVVSLIQVQNGRHGEAAPLEIAQRDRRLLRATGQNGDHRRVARHAAGRFFDQGRQREAVGQLDAGQRLQNSHELLGAAAGLDHQRPEPVASFVDAGRGHRLAPRAVIVGPAFLPNPVSRIAPVGHQPDLLAHQIDRIGNRCRRRHGQLAAMRLVLALVGR